MENNITYEVQGCDNAHYDYFGNFIIINGQVPFEIENNLEENITNQVGNIVIPMNTNFKA